MGPLLNPLAVILCSLTCAILVTIWSWLYPAYNHAYKWILLSCVVLVCLLMLFSLRIWPGLDHVALHLLTAFLVLILPLILIK
ncbi:MAG TPA: hypothetical protein VN436_01170 [Holophaga sp.]|nr:hypothetical protein [Holophaga sp.]